MANEEHLAILKQGVEKWNQWRGTHQRIRLDLSGADLTEADLTEADLTEVNLVRANLVRANLSEANLSGANLSEANLCGADLDKAKLIGANLSGAKLDSGDLSLADFTEADLTGADLSKANLFGTVLSRADLSGAVLPVTDLSLADFTGAKLTGANLFGADLTGADLTGADLTEAILENARLIETSFAGANLTGCKIFGISAWNIYLTGARQADLVITSFPEPVITVDNLEVAQFIHLLLHNEKIREVIDTISQKGVLILGRFAGERKAVLDALRTALRQRDFLPIVFDFEKPTQRDFTETIRTLAGLSVFVIADITNPRSAPLELQATVPDYMIPFVPIIAEGESPFAMFIDLQRKYDWVLDVLEYDSIDHLLAGLEDAVIVPALQAYEALVQRRARVVGTRHITQYLGKRQ